MSVDHSDSIILQIALAEGEEVLQAAVQWHLNGEREDGTTLYFQTVDVHLRTIPPTTVETWPTNQVQLKHGHLLCEIKALEISKFLVSVVKALMHKRSRETAIKLVLPIEDGYVVRSDFLQQRVYGCPNVHWKREFVQPREYLKKPHIPSDGVESFSQILSSTAGALVVDEVSGRSQDSLLLDLEAELQGRISYPWLIRQPIPARTIAILGHRSLFMMKRWFAIGQTMGIKVLVFGERGSWLEQPQHSHRIEKFLPIDMNVDQGLPSRILGALQESGHTIDGITTTIDVYFDAVARVSKFLNLQTSPIESIAISQDKYATRTLFGNEAQNLLVSDAEDLRQQLEAGSVDLSYPLIVKPSKGWCSEGVFKVTDETELFAAVKKLAGFAPNIMIIVESYVDGPEFDANFLLWEGEILFFEVVDDFPCSADEEGSAKTANFQELEMVYPSNLVEREKDILRAEIYQFLISIGFRTGIFHVEARIQNSAMEYNNQDGVTDLRLKHQAPEAKPKVFILEVNVRCPGWMVIWATAYAYGVDYAAFQMLAALGDEDRARVIAQPFAFGPQATVESVFVPTPRGGTLGPKATCEELAVRRPDLMTHVVRLQTMAQPGETVPDPSSGTLSFVGAFNLATNVNRVSRTEMLRVGQTLRKELRVDIG